MNLYEQTKQFLISEDFRFQERISENNKFIVSKVEGENVTINCFIHFFENKNILICFSELPFRIQKEKRTEIISFLSSLNNELMITNFLISEVNGTIRLKSVLYQDSSISVETFRKFFFTNFSTLDLYAPKIMAKLISSSKDLLLPEHNKLNLN